MIKAFKRQLYPTKEQEPLFWQSTGVARWAYNWTLGRQQENYDNGGQFIKDGELRKELTQLKKLPEYQWLNDVSAQIPKQAVKDACEAYKRFFTGKAKFPQFKSKRKSKPAFYHRCDQRSLKIKESKINY